MDVQECGAQLSEEEMSETDTEGVVVVVVVGFGVVTWRKWGLVVGVVV